MRLRVRSGIKCFTFKIRSAPKAIAQVRRLAGAIRGHGILRGLDNCIGRIPTCSKVVAINEDCRVKQHTNICSILIQKDL